MPENTLINTAKNKAMALCARTEYCSSAIRSRLKSWGVSDADAGMILSELIKERFIDDNRYTSAFVRDRFIHNKWGKMKIASHLKMDKIPEETIQAALGEIDDAIYLKTIREIINDHKKSVKAKNQYDLKGKLLRFGLSKGFESHLLYDILNESDSGDDL